MSRFTKLTPIALALLTSCCIILLAVSYNQHSAIQNLLAENESQARSIKANRDLALANARDLMHTELTDGATLFSLLPYVSQLQWLGYYGNDLRSLAEKKRDLLLLADNAMELDTLASYGDELQMVAGLHGLTIWQYELEELAEFLYPYMSDLQYLANRLR